MLLLDAQYATRGLGAYQFVHDPEHVTVVDDPVLGSRGRVVRLETHDSPSGSTVNPRTQLDPPALLQAGRTYWFGFGLLLPRDWPTVPDGGWLAFAEVYGPPFAGSGPFTLKQQGDRFVLGRNGRYGWDTVWSVPLRRGVWLDFAWQVHLSPDPAAGFYEVWLNTGAGWGRQTLAGRDRLHMVTLDAANGGGPNMAQLKNYRQAGMWPGAHTCYFAAHKVGCSLADVDPHSHG